MKIKGILFVFLILFGFSALACVDITGHWICTNDSDTKNVIYVDSWKSEGTQQFVMYNSSDKSLLSKNDFPYEISPDNKIKDNDSDETKYQASCEGESLVFQLQTASFKDVIVGLKYTFSQGENDSLKLQGCSSLDGGKLSLLTGVQNVQVKCADKYAKTMTCVHSTHSHQLKSFSL
jgi:hypothetical protein